MSPSLLTTYLRARWHVDPGRWTSERCTEAPSPSSLFVCLNFCLFTAYNRELCNIKPCFFHISVVHSIALCILRITHHSFIRTIHSYKPVIHTHHPFMRSIHSYAPSIHTHRPFIQTIHPYAPSIHTNRSFIYREPDVTCRTFKRAIHLAHHVFMSPYAIMEWWWDYRELVL